MVIIMYNKFTEEELFIELNSKKEGLSSEEVKERIKKYGKNTLPKEKKKGPVKIFLEQLKNPIIYILIVTTILSFIIGEVVDAIFIIVIILIDALLGTFQEYRASKASESLLNLIKVNSKVIRDNKEQVSNAPRYVQNAPYAHGRPRCV